MFDSYGGKLWNINENNESGNGDTDINITEEQRRLALRKRILARRNQELLEQRKKQHGEDKYNNVVPIIKLIIIKNSE
ncbi:hypothetical protein QE152_g30714 [Popillia japonica]|uniref:Uncharacterized protein n=1 Tax=Popillia japonica TaxID=7064 RepID=A0AAW1JEV0_POPJA